MHAARIYSNTYKKVFDWRPAGKCEIEMPRDRNGEFEPKVIAKRQTLTN